MAKEEAPPGGKAVSRIFRFWHPDEYGVYPHLSGPSKIFPRGSISPHSQMRNYPILLKFSAEFNPKPLMSNSLLILPNPPKLIGIAADHGGFELKQYLTTKLRDAGHSVIDFGDRQDESGDDYPDFVVPLARAVASGDITRGIAICGSGVGAAVAANKVNGVRACLINESFSAHEGVEDDDLNLICLDGLVTGQALAWELVQIFLTAGFHGAERHRRRLDKLAALEQYEDGNQYRPPIVVKLAGSSNGTSQDLVVQAG